MNANIEITVMDMFRDMERPLLIAGPCSAESENQVMKTAGQLSAMGTSVYRAGIWKPRTRPDTFEGVGSVGLPWLRRVKEETGMLTATEVANVWHVREAIKYGIDILWIGARTTANPFAVQEIADAVRGMDIPIFIKNPVNPDIELWIGAFERFNRSGITKMAAVHRGFSHYGESPYRNLPQWEIPIELKRRFPHLPLLTDPSHICGRRDLLFNVAQTAMDLNFEGLFVESHINPDQALSDREQQLTPSDLEILLGKLILRNADINGSMHAESLEEYRRQIDRFDDELLRVLSGRMAVSEKIGEYKKRERITILQSSRWSEILETRLDRARKLGLSESFIIQVFKQIHQESINFQNKVMN